MTEVGDALKMLKIELAPWQKHIAERAMAGENVVVYPMGRRTPSGRALMRALARLWELFEVRSINRALPFAHPIALWHEPIVFDHSFDHLDALLYSYAAIVRDPNKIVWVSDL